MHLRKRLRRLHGRLAQSLDSLLPSDDNATPSTTSGNDPGPRASAVPSVTRADGQSREITPPPPNAGSSMHMPERSSTASQPTATPTSTTDAEGDGTHAWPRLKSFLRMLDQSPIAFGPLKVVTSGLVDCIEIYEKAANNRKAYDELRIELENIFANLEQFLTQRGSHVVTTSMESLCKSVQNELEYVQGKQNRDSVERHLEARDDSDEVLACYQRIQTYLQRLSLNVNLSMWKIVDEQATNTLLDRLCSSMSACYNSSEADELKRRPCTPNTRVEALGHIHGWVHNPATGSIYWLNGMAGTGKTTIAYTLCAGLEAASQLGASFFCSRSLPECRDVNKILPSIAYQLARFSRPFRSALSQVLEKEPDVHTRLIAIQFQSLIVKPLLIIRDTLPENLVVVIDALDECDNQESTGRILDALFRMAPDLPIKFFVSSRPEPAIRDQMQKQGDHRKSSRMVLHDLDKGTVQGDIETYLREALAQIHPTEFQIRTLVQRAGILFIYAATVARYIGHDNFRRNPRARLQTVVSTSTPSGSSPYKGIDELYTIILSTAINDTGLNDVEKEDIKNVLYTVICAQAPLTIRGLSGLLQLHDIERVEAALRPLWSVLHVVETSGLVTTLHASFPDYMFDSTRSKEYHCDSLGHDRALAKYCFDCIKSAAPSFNICRLESSYIPDDRIPNMNAKADEAISPELLYACRFWASHLEPDKGSYDLIEQLKALVSTRLLLWMEVMNLRKCMHEGVGVMQQAEKWCARRECSEDLIQLMHDAWRFVAAYTSSPVSQSTPHIYVSMLPFWPESSPLGKHYAGRTRVPAVPQGPAISRRRLELLASWTLDGEIARLAWSPDGARLAAVADGGIFLLDGLTGRVLLGPLKEHEIGVTSVAFSPDSTCIVSGSNNGIICIWDVQSERIALGPLTKHSDMVNSVAFSPDGTRIISGSGSLFGTPSDSSIWVWDIQTGQGVLGPLKGHTDAIASIAFSPDGARIISGSDDKTICVWDMQSGQMVLGPLQGHDDYVRSVAVSPDGTRIVSGSDDRTIRVWDMQSGEIVLGPLEGHDGYVRSVGISPDGTRIVSGSDDTTICVWDTQNGQMVLGPLKGHAGHVTSVGFSPDGTRIISGANDKTIHIWDIHSSQTTLDPLEGHTGSVNSVGFSPDGTRIVSSSRDSTIRVWDTQSGRTVLGPLEGHAGGVQSVGFSPDGTRIVSGSADQTIRVWDIQNGQTVLDPLEGHTGEVQSVGFSPDGTHIVSGSDDCTIRVWDVQSGQTILGPLNGHTRTVGSVMFSPDGTCIVSGSWDATIRVWDMKSGQTVLGPLEGHSNDVNSVAFSPNGTYIASGSIDRTVHVWDTRTGQTVLGPLQGHTDSVRSIAFSPDETRIVSGSTDSTIRVWDMQTGQIVLGPLTGHTDRVWSVGFSPDGTRIVSGSGDHTIRVWDVRDKQTASHMQPLDSALPALLDWEIDSNGWVTDNQSGLLVWVPPDLRNALRYDPREILRFSSVGDVCLNFDDVRIGESWAECYQPV